MGLCRRVFRMLGGLLITIPATAMTVVSDDAIRILVLTPLEGAFAGSGGQGSVIAAEMAVEAMPNRAAGAPIEIIVRDSRIDPDHALEQLRAVHTQTPVDMVTGHLTTGVGLRIQAYAEDNGIIVLHSGPSSTAFTNESCSPIAVQWGFDTRATATAAVSAALDDGADRWFFLAADYEYGRNVHSQVTEALERLGGDDRGSVILEYPTSTSTLTDAYQQAIASGANVLGLAMGGEDMAQAIRHGYELGVKGEGLDMIAIEFFLNDIRNLGLYATAGLKYATSFYWARSDGARAWAEQFSQRSGAMPTSPQAGVYSATLHYLRAVDAAGTDALDAVMRRMRETPVSAAYSRTRDISARTDECCTV